ncbi:T9SS type A sorting domain-containing protein [Winogradskyella litoriviva]|uniref:T9SS type A sorting domain-containing protein n=1 Tax=Winogradskyella litoriviva TaxID=1220182 RepID=A0ABX2E0A0_9FLAO|nr:T9SS type A sorting domain-containing protein [Winogradskyella litoriviva]NRD21669.1 T9SS type A sorting domain-containing protein [Winogradskyella litoriviva]
MKKITLLLTLFFTSSLIFGQVVLTEDFEAGTTIPAGWTNNDIAGGGEIWTISSGADAIGFTAGNGYNYSLGEMDGNFALFDSDGYGGTIAENAAMESPTFDCSSLASVTLSYNHFFTSGYSAEGYVEVSTDGTTWTQVAFYTGDAAANSSFGFESIDVSTELAGAAAAQVRFRWVGNYSWAWAFDNVSVFQCTVAAPDAVATVTTPADAATGVEIFYGAPDNLGPFEWVEPTTGAAIDSYNINLGETATGDDIGTVEGFANGNSINFDWQPNTTYYWSIDAVNCAGVTPGPIWSFTTAACAETAAPALVTAPYPSDAAAAVALQSPDYSAEFSWTAANADDTFVLNLGTENPPTQSFNDFENGGTITGLALSTTYYWSVDVINCFGTTTGTVWSFTTDAALGVEDNFDSIKTFSVYPNPTSGTLNIKSAQDVDNITVFNLLGQNVASFSKNEITNSSIDMSNLSKGLYLVKITSGDKTETLRVTKE